MSPSKKPLRPCREQAEQVFADGQWSISLLIMTDRLDIGKRTHEKERAGERNHPAEGEGEERGVRIQGQPDQRAEANAQGHAEGIEAEIAGSPLGGGESR